MRAFTQAFRAFSQYFVCSARTTRCISSMPPARLFYNNQMKL